MKHQLTLTVATDAMLQQDHVRDLVFKLLEIGQADAADTADDPDSCDLSRAEAALVRDMEFTLVPVPPPTTQLAAQARLFVMALDELGFGKDEPINGGDTVEFVDKHQALLRRLPALAELAGAVEAFRVGRGQAANEQNLRRMYEILEQVKS
jgi:hypothetical protein